MIQFYMQPLFTTLLTQLYSFVPLSRCNMYSTPVGATRVFPLCVQLEARTTVFKRDLEEKYSLKMKASRAFFSEVNQRFPTLPFTLRAGDERAWRMGVVECVKHGLFKFGHAGSLAVVKGNWTVGPNMSTCKYLAMRQAQITFAFHTWSGPRARKSGSPNRA